MTQDSPHHKQPPPDREQQYDAFVALLARHDLAIRRFVRFLMPSRDGVDDVMQETALECWKKYSEFQPSTTESATDDFVRWACVIARYKSLSWQLDRPRDRLMFRESAVEQLSQTAVDSLGRGEEQRLAVEACLEKLPAGAPADRERRSCRSTIQRQ